MAASTSILRQKLLLTSGAARLKSAGNGIGSPGAQTRASGWQQTTLMIASMKPDPCRAASVRAWIWHGIRFAFSLLLLCQAHVYAQSGPQPPCGVEPIPPYPSLGDVATVTAWSKSDFGRDWKPPACTGWTAAGFSTLVTTVARFHHDSGADGLLRRVGAISELAGVRYWSTTHQRWQTLINDAHALAGPQLGLRREDFALDEMKKGKVLYFEQVDNLAGKATYRMHITEASADRLVFDVENISTMRYLMIPVLHAGDMQSIYFMDRESEDIWRFYSMVRTGREANGMMAGNRSSAINRAVAFYRHFLGIPTGQEPPAAR